MRPVRVFSTMIACALLLLLGTPTTSQATVTMSEDVFTLTPSAPGPSENVQISFQNAHKTPAGSTLRWFVDGTELTTSYNRQSINITTKPVGATEVFAVLTTPTESETYTLSIDPVRVDLIINSDSHTPNFYRGRSLPALGSTITAQALVFSEEQQPLSYLWTVNGQAVNQTVGRNNNSIQYTIGGVHELRVTVKVYNATGEHIATKSLKFIPTEPEILFYEKNPLLGLIPNVLANPYRFLNHEMTLRGEPFFFSNNPDDLKIGWKVDRTKLESNENPFEISLIKTKESGSAVIRLNIINTENHLTSDEAKLTITY